MTTSLGLRGQTAAALQAFKQRNENARRRLAALQEQQTTVDFARYKGVLKNRAVVDEVERRFREFKPATYDLQRQLKAIDAFEAEAVRNAQEAKQKVDLEIKDLQATLTNIETARPWEDLTVVRVVSLVENLYMYRTGFPAIYRLEEGGEEGRKEEERKKEKSIVCQRSWGRRGPPLSTLLASHPPVVVPVTVPLPVLVPMVQV